MSSPIIQLEQLEKALGGRNLLGLREGRDPELREEVRELGFPLRTVERFGGHERGYWVGVTLDPKTGLRRAASLRLLGGVAVGR